MTLRSSAEPPFPCFLGRSSAAPCAFTCCTDPPHRCSVSVHLFSEAPQRCSMLIYLFAEASQQCSMSVPLFPDAEQHCSMVVHLLHGPSAALLRVRETVP